MGTYKNGVIDKPESSLGYLWNVPVSYLNANNDYSISWMLADGSDLTMQGVLGYDLWLDPEAYGFYRINYGSALDFRNVSFN